MSGVKVARTDALLMLVLSLAILATLTVIGVTLVAATLVVPAVVARMLTDRFARMLWLSSGIGAACGFVGMNLSYHLDVPSGTTIVLDGSRGLHGGPDGHRRAGPPAYGPDGQPRRTRPRPRRRPSR